MLTNVIRFPRPPPCRMQQVGLMNLDDNMLTTILNNIMEPIWKEDACCLPPPVQLETLGAYQGNASYWCSWREAYPRGMYESNDCLWRFGRAAPDAFPEGMTLITTPMSLVMKVILIPEFLI